MFLMCEDIDFSVCEAALELMARLAELGLLGEEEVSALEELVLATDKAVGHPVGQLHDGFVDN
jgi:hypothetical protein